jgi:hypothetical protein
MKTENRFVLRIIILLAMAFLAPGPGSCLDYHDTFERAAADCSVGGYDFKLVLRAFTRDVVEDEANIGYPLLYLVDDAPVLVAQTTPDDHSEGAFIFSGGPGICRGTDSYLFGNNTVAFVFMRMPILGPWVPHVLFYDFKEKTIEGPISMGRAKFIGRDGAALLFSPRMSRSEARSGFALIRGRKFSWTEEDLEAVKTVSLTSGTVSVSYDQARSWKNSRWGRFFKTKRDFLKAAQWDAKRKEFGAGCVLHAESGSPPQNECVLFLKELGAAGPKLKDDLPWICKTD